MIYQTFNFKKIRLYKKIAIKTSNIKFYISFLFKYFNFKKYILKINNKISINKFLNSKLD